jgi:hypothetical protein
VSSQSARADELESFLSLLGLSEQSVRKALEILRKAEDEARREGLRRAAFDYERAMNAAVNAAYSVIAQDGGEEAISGLVLGIYALNPRKARTTSDPASSGDVRVLLSRASDPQVPLQRYDPPGAEYQPRPNARPGYVEADGDAI